MWARLTPPGGFRQDIALLDARRGVTLFRKLAVPPLGLVENMSFHQCAACGHREYVFGREGALATARELGIDVLGQAGAFPHSGVRLAVHVLLLTRTQPCCHAWLSGLWEGWHSELWTVHASLLPVPSLPPALVSAAL